MAGIIASDNSEIMDWDWGALTPAAEVACEPPAVLVAVAVIEEGASAQFTVEAV